MTPIGSAKNLNVYLNRNNSDKSGKLHEVEISAKYHGECGVLG